MLHVWCGYIHTKQLFLLFKCVLFNDTVDCYEYTAFLIDE